MKYGYTILYVENVAETIEFYEKAFGFHRKFITAENDYGELLTGETTLAFASIELGKKNLKSGFENINNSGKLFGARLQRVPTYQSKNKFGSVCNAANHYCANPFAFYNK